MGPKQILVVAVAVAGGLFLAACSDDAEALSKGEFVEQADAICQATNEEVEPAEEEFWSTFEDVDYDDPANQDLLFTNFAELVAVTAESWEQQIADLRELKPPAEDAEFLENLLDDFDAALAEMVETTEAAAAGDEAARARMESDTEDPMTDLNRQAREYGMVVCGAEE